MSPPENRMKKKTGIKFLNVSTTVQISDLLEQALVQILIAHWCSAIARSRSAQPVPVQILDLHNLRIVRGPAGASADLRSAQLAYRARDDTYPTLEFEPWYEGCLLFGKRLKVEDDHCLVAGIVQVWCLE
ncbi:hypothetical protein Adt_36410 [Abeliophyllum distichum]|uniref:Uncharacterized protein n=1 Tax=Abeliophyllum distichum TaxID=126358 RepID=A0ABD1QL47_9LAMI